MSLGFSELLERNEDHHATYANETFDHVQDGQQPEYVTVCCSDSRVLQDEMFDNQEPGAIFTAGNIGNRVIEDTEEGIETSGDVLYPLAHAGTEKAVVIGHTSCGAVTATYQDITDGIDEPAGIRHCVDLLRTRLEDGVERLQDGLDDDEAVNRLVEYNVDRQVEHLLESEDVPDEVDVLGVVYDFQDVYTDDRGRLHVVNVNGENDPDMLREEYPALASRVSRLWTY
jgi:carbonic anhydrase